MSVVTNVDARGELEHIRARHMGYPIERLSELCGDKGITVDTSHIGIQTVQFRDM